MPHSDSTTASRRLIPLRYMGFLHFPIQSNSSSITVWAGICNCIRRLPPIFLCFGCVLPVLWQKVPVLSLVLQRGPG